MVIAPTARADIKKSKSLETQSKSLETKSKSLEDES